MVRLSPLLNVHRTEEELKARSVITSRLVECPVPPLPRRGSPEAVKELHLIASAHCVSLFFSLTDVNIKDPVNNRKKRNEMADGLSLFTDKIQRGL